MQYICLHKRTSGVIYCVMSTLSKNAKTLVLGLNTVPANLMFRGSQNGRISVLTTLSPWDSLSILSVIFVRTPSLSFLTCFYSFVLLNTFLPFPA